MKCKVLAVLISISATIMLTGCGESATKCDDSNAQGLVMEIVEEEFKDQVLGGEGLYLSYKKSQSADAQEAAQMADNKFIESNPKLTSIRIESIDDALQKSECAAEINFANGNKIDITYSLSKTTDGDLYAEVSGL